MFHVIELETNGFDLLNKENPHLIRQFDVIIHGREGGVHRSVVPLAEELLRCRKQTALIAAIFLMK